MNTGVTGFCQFCHTPYNTYHHIISLFNSNVNFEILHKTTR